MRFQNWDVLVFPASEATPIQEFRTEFCNILDPGSFLQLCIRILSFADIALRDLIDHAFLSRMTSEDPEAPGKDDSKVLPTVTTYIPMLHPGTPFQISIHSWTTPEVSANLEPGSQAMIEARLFIDGAPITLAGNL